MTYTTISHKKILIADEEILIPQDRRLGWMLLGLCVCQ